MSRIVGTNGDDTLVGTSKADVILGLGGDDTITGRGGADRIDGGPGFDQIGWKTGDGNDVVTGGPGDDLIRFDNSASPATSYAIDDPGGYLRMSWSGPHGATVEATSGSVSLQAGPGDDHFVLKDTGSLGGDTDLTIFTGGGHDTVDGHAVRYALDIASDGDSTITGGSGDDFFGSGGHDIIDGNAGNDRFFAGDGDVITGGLGDDLLRLPEKGHVVFATGPGDDTVQVGRPVPTGASAEITDFDPAHDQVYGDDITGPPPYRKLDTNHDGAIDAGDHTVHDGANGLTVDLTPAFFGHGRGAVVLTFDHLHSVPLDAFA